MKIKMDSVINFIKCKNGKHSFKKVDGRAFTHFPNTIVKGYYGLMVQTRTKYKCAHCEAIKLEENLTELNSYYNTDSPTKVNNPMKDHLISSDKKKRLAKRAMKETIKK
jgi:hypothetical protein